MSGVDPQRLLNKVSPFEEGPLGCRPWLGALSKGRAIIHDPEVGQPVQASRALWEHLWGPIPRGLFVMHLCDHGYCLAPGGSHLVLGSQTTNLLHASLAARTAIGRGVGGGRGGMSRLPLTEEEREAEAIAIREKHLRKIERMPVQHALF
ncbi:hypothetical protein [Modestobacter sp. KNN46-3]|uniref:hypothetical protein n=1 Tax=Modestobacter sp. KNN46-3 TaxID=2711218 RepID=UPI0013DE7AF5|nr:hypothetical protein [Modestobacter sp. KNN46-3]